jgi:hypothetical protein
MTTTSFAPGSDLQGSVARGIVLGCEDCFTASSD